jgi:hypothetical protein
MNVYCLNMHLAPGDLVVLSALARDLALADPAHRVFVDCPYAELFWHNPRVRPAAGVVQAYPAVHHVKLEYGRGISGPSGQKHRTVHFLKWLYEDFAAKVGFEPPITRPHGDFHFGPDELEPLVSGRYWVVAAGGKSDFPTKLWEPGKWRAVAAALQALGLGVVRVGSARERGSVRNIPPPELPGAVDLVGRTSLRQLARVIRDADGVLGGVSLPMHLAAALERPAVILGGAREAWTWEAYSNANAGFGTASGTFSMSQRYLHTFGVLDCTDKFREGPHWGGCWRRHLEAGEKQPCYAVVDADGGGRVAACLRAITVEKVLENVLAYYVDGGLPPLG